MYEIATLEKQIFSYLKRCSIAVIILTVMVFTLSAMTGGETEPQTPLEVAVGWIALLWLLSIGILIGIILVFFLLRKNIKSGDT
jgi:hypothetical protein